MLRRSKMGLKYLIAALVVLLAVLSFPGAKGAPSMDDDIPVQLNVTDDTQNSNDSCTQYLDAGSCCENKCSFCLRDYADKKECSSKPCEDNRVDHCAPAEDGSDTLTTASSLIADDNSTTTPSPSSNDTTTEEPPTSNTTSVPVPTTTDANSTTPNVTTVSPNITSTTPEPEPVTTPVPSNDTTTVAPTTPDAPTNSTPVASTTPIPVPSNTTGSSVNTTTPGKSPSGGDDDGQRFDGASFIGGIVLCGGLMALAFFGMKFYKGRKEQNYHTL